MLLDLMLASVEEISKEVKIGGSLGSSNRVLVKFMISRSISPAKGRVRTPNFWLGINSLFKGGELLAQAAQRSCACPVSGGVQGQAGWGSE